MHKDAPVLYALSRMSDIEPRIQNITILIGTGVFLMGMTVYTQFSSMDLGAYSITEYLQRDIIFRPWWSAIGLPVLLGFLFLMVAAYCYGKGSHAAKAVLFLVVLSVLLSVVSVLLGLVGSVNSLVVYLRLRQVPNVT